MYRVPYGKRYLEFELPPGMHGSVAESRPAEPIIDVGRAITDALSHPINIEPLRKMAKPGDTACIVFTDITRASPDHLLVPAVLTELKAAGLHDKDITLLCAVGMHRPSTFEEKIAKLGSEVVKRYRVLDHEPQRPDMLVDLGVTKGGIPLSVNKIAYAADWLIATGIVEPHQYSGYSGGRKTLAIGAAGEAVIAHTHGPQMVDHPKTRLGRVKGNPFHDAISEAAKRAGLKFIINVVQDDHKRPVAILAGEPEVTFLRLVEIARKLYEVPIPGQVDVAVAGVGFPKDANIYQASRAVSYLFFAPTPVVREGGVFILPAPIPEGAGEGVGEKRFLEKMKNAKDMPSLLMELRRTGYPPGAQRAFVMAKVLEKAHVIVAGSRMPELVRQVHMIPAADMNQAFQTASDILGRKDLKVLVVPHAMLTLPIVGG